MQLKQTIFETTKMISLQVRVAGHYVTVLLDPNSFDAVINDTVFLDFTRTRNQLLKRIFSLQLPSLKSTAERKWMEQ